MGGGATPPPSHSTQFSHLIPIETHVLACYNNNARADAPRTSAPSRVADTTSHRRSVQELSRRRWPCLLPKIGSNRPPGSKFIIGTAIGAAVSPARGSALGTNTKESNHIKDRVPWDLPPNSCLPTTNLSVFAQHCPTASQIDSCDKVIVSN